MTHTAHVIIGLVMALGVLVSRNGFAQAPRSNVPDIVLHNGKVFTGVPGMPWAEAVAIRGDRIDAVGSNAQVRATAGAATRLIDVGGRVVIPGVNDTHVHLGNEVAIGSIVNVDFGDDWARGPAPAPIVDSLVALARRTPPGVWLRGRMGLAVRYSPLRRATLDSIAPDHPVILTAMYGHGTLVNSRAMRLMGISDTASDPSGGWYERVPGSRTITGLLEGSAQFDAWNAYFASDHGPMIATLRGQAENALRYGITSMQHMASLTSALSTEQIFRKADLPLRIRIIAWPYPGRRAEWIPLAGRRLTPLTSISGVKYMLEGTPIEQWALRRRPYDGRPGWHGRMYYDASQIRQVLVDALGDREQLMLHIVGDSSAALVLGLMTELAPDSVWRGRRVRVEHANAIAGPTIAVARRLGLVPSQARGSGAQMRAWHDAGIIAGYGSDGQGTPWVALRVATTTPDSAQAMTRADAIRMMTYGSAYAERAEHEKGTLAPGQLADLAVLSQDVFTVAADSLPATVSVLTIVNGVVRHDAGVLGAPSRP